MLLERSAAFLLQLQTKGRGGAIVFLFLFDLRQFPVALYILLKSEQRVFLIFQTCIGPVLLPSNLIAIVAGFGRQSLERGIKQRQSQSVLSGVHIDFAEPRSTSRQPEVALALGENPNR